MSNEDSNLDGNWATKLEVYTGVVALEKQVNEQIQDLRNDLNQIKIERWTKFDCNQIDLIQIKIHFLRTK